MDRHPPGHLRGNQANYAVLQHLSRCMPVLYGCMEVMGLRGRCYLFIFSQPQPPQAKASILKAKPFLIVGNQEAKQVW